MKLVHSVAARVVASGTVTMLFAGTLYFLALGDFLSRRSLGLVAAPLASALRGPAGAECRASPGHYSSELPGGVHLDGYSSESLLGDEPPEAMDPLLFARARSGVESSSRNYLTGRYGGAALVRIAPEGPCSVVQLSWVPVGPIRGAVSFWITTSMLALGIGALAWVGLGLWLLRPTAARMRRLHAAAQHVGDPAGFVSARDTGHDELGELSQAVDGAHTRILSGAAELQKREAALREHMSNVAHDLKTPMAALAVMLHTARTSASEAARREALGAALEQVFYVAALTDNLRVAAHLREGLGEPGKRARLDLREIVERAGRRLMPIAERRGIELGVSVPDSPVVVEANGLLLEQAISNLVHNAIVHHDRPGGEEGHVALILRGDGARFQIEVLDDGPGVPASELPRLVERSYRAPSATSEGGSGLGLSIVRAVAERHGFDVEIEVAEERGLVVRINGIDGGYRGHRGG